MKKKIGRGIFIVLLICWKFWTWILVKDFEFKTWDLGDLKSVACQVQLKVWSSSRVILVNVRLKSDLTYICKILFSVFGWYIFIYMRPLWMSICELLLKCFVYGISNSYQKYFSILNVQIELGSSFEVELLRPYSNKWS